jgi:hypothetical protein
MLKQLLTIAVAIGVGACSPAAPANDTPAADAVASPEAADPATSGAPVVIADAATWPECGSLPAPAPETRYIAVNCRVDAKADGVQFLVRFSPTPEEVMAGGRIDVDVAGPDGAVRDTLTEAYVFQYRYPSLSDTDGDGVAELLIAREVADGEVTRSIWKRHPADGRYRQTGTLKAPL